MDESLKNAGQVLINLSEKVTAESDGGSKITLSELMDVVVKAGIEIVNDLQD
jgi:hypothetical protein